LLEIERQGIQRWVVLRKGRFSGRRDEDRQTDTQVFFFFYFLGIKKIMKDEYDKIGDFDDKIMHY
jgi:hypothetical protein